MSNPDTGTQEPQSGDSRLGADISKGVPLDPPINLEIKNGKIRRATGTQELREELEFEGKTIFVEWFDTDSQLMAALKRDDVKPQYESIAYCDTYSDERTDAWGKIYLLKDSTLGTVAHEACHLASGILSRKGHKSIELTSDQATEVEEEFCELVGGVADHLAEAHVNTRLAAILDRALEQKQPYNVYVGRVKLQEFAIPAKGIEALRKEVSEK